MMIHDEELAENEQKVIEEAVDKMLEGLPNSKEISELTDDLDVKETYSTPIENAVKRNLLSEFPEKPKRKSLRRKQLDSAVNGGVTLPASFSDIGNRSRSGSDDQAFLDEFEIPERSEVSGARRKNPIRKKFIEEEGYNSDEGATSPHYITENGLTENFDQAFQELKEAGEKDEPTQSGSTKPLRASITKPKTEIHNQLPRKSRFYSQKNIENESKSVEKHQDTKKKEPENEHEQKLKKAKVIIN